jgi:thiol-disulfide isomerase/thioredoxin
MLCFINGASAQSDVPENTDNSVVIYFFWGEGCPHCQNVKDSGILEEVSNLKNVDVHRLEVYYNQSNRNKYIEFADKLGVSGYEQDVPFLVIECNDKYSYLMGDSPIIENLEDKVTHCNFDDKSVVDPGETSSDSPNSKEITIGSIIIASLIDSINPCAFGVLLFLWTTMLSMGSSKRALKYGLVYIFVIFLVYFSAGLGIIKILNPTFKRF